MTNKRSFRSVAREYFMRKRATIEKRREGWTGWIEITIGEENEARRRGRRETRREKRVSKKRCRSEIEGRGEDEKESKKKFYENLFPIVVADRCIRLAVFGPEFGDEFYQVFHEAARTLYRSVVLGTLCATLSQRVIFYFARFEEIVSLVEKFLN